MGIKILVASSVPISILIRLLFFIRPRLFARYRLAENRLIIERGKKKFELQFKDISRILISKVSPRFLGGFMVEMQSGMKLRFPSALAGNHLILAAASRERPELLPDKLLEPYVALCQQVDASWQRMAKKLRNIPLMAVKYLLLPGLLCAFWYQQFPSPEGAPFWDRFLLVAGAHCLFVYTIAFLVNHLEERAFLKLYAKSLGEDGKKRPGEIPWDRELNWAAQALFYILCLGLYYLKVS